MDSRSKITGEFTPGKESSRSKCTKISKRLENSDPNVSSPGLKSSNSPLIKSARSARSKNYISRNPNPVGGAEEVASPSPVKKIRQRKFFIASKKPGKEEVNSSTEAPARCNKCKKATGKSKCMCLAYESLRASQEGFFKSGSNSDDIDGLEKLCADDIAKQASEVNPTRLNPETAEGSGGGPVEENGVDVVDINGEMGIKRRRGKQLNEERVCVPESGTGKVMHLVKAFEELSKPKSNDNEENEMDKVEGINKEIKNTLEVDETQVSSSSFRSSDAGLTLESLGLDSASHHSSLGSSQGSFSISSKTSASCRKSRRKSLGSSGSSSRRNRRRQPKETSQKPFMLRTEQRGRCKEEELAKKLQQKMEEEEKLRVPVAQGLPWTTDQPELLVKPPVKDSTRPLDLVLQSNIRAVERAEFDRQVADKLSFIEQYKMERERQRKLEEEEEIRRVRRDLVPRAQPVPYFDKPFIPRRSIKHHPTTEPTAEADASHHVKI